MLNSKGFKCEAVVGLPTNSDVPDIHPENSRYRCFSFTILRISFQVSDSGFIYNFLSINQLYDS